MRLETSLDPVPLPDAIRDKSGNPIVCACPICGAMNIGAPPHGEGEPCPIAIALLETRQTNYDRQAFMANDLMKMMRRMGVIGEDDDE